MSTGSFKPGALAHVETIHSDDETTLVFKRSFSHSIQQVWEALTDPEKLNEWAPTHLIAIFPKKAQPF